ncbi:MAG: monovalent cation/H+ antiporter subunit D family protein [Desulfuromonadales bacterium]|nr:monovalent cation/H+ antiporter subunit D family protein [Desulfuromonadales bacterium]
MMQNLPLFVLVAPLLAALFVNVLGRLGRGWVAPLVLGSLAFSTLAAVGVLMRVLSEGTIRYTVGGWRPPYGIELVVDPLSALMLLLISAVALTASFSALPTVERELAGREHLFFTLYLILIAGLIGLAITGDAFNLYVLLEITSITSYGLIGMASGRAPLSSFTYIIMGSIGACFYLLGTGYLYLLTGTLNMSDIQAILPGLHGSFALATAFAFMLVGMWIKMAFFPLHGWLPNAYSLAPTGAALLMAPLMTKITIFLMIRVMFSIFTPEYVFLQHVGFQSGIVWAAAIGIVCASALALAQRELKRMLAYIIVAEVGYMVGGVWLANTQGMTGAILHIVNDALMTLCLFLAAAAIVYRTGNLQFESLRGLYRKMPVTMAAFTVGAFSMIGIPPTCGFFSKWYLIMGGIEAGQWGYVVALLFSSLVNAVLFFRLIEIAYFPAEAPAHGDGHHHEPPGQRQEAPWRLLHPLVLTAIALVVVGLSTGPLVDIIHLALPAGF